MARINTNLPAITARHHLTRSMNSLQQSLERLSSGLRINRGADDPAGLIVSQNLRAEIASVRQAIANSERASNIIATTEGALDEVAALLNDMKAKILEAANSGGISDDEIRANQLQIDSAVESITRIANSTTFAGRRLLNGSLDYTTSGINPGQISDVRINAATFGTASYVPVSVNVVQSAQHGQLRFATSAISSDVTLEIAGPRGVTTLPLQSGARASAILAAINIARDSTGVSASFINASNLNSGIVINTQAYGSAAFVSVREIGVTTDVFVTQDVTGNVVDRDAGRDAAAMINGASVLARGLDLYLNTANLGVELRLQESFNVPGSTSFAITGGGAMFQVGPGVNTNEQVNIGVGSTNASRLGRSDVGYLAQIVSGGDYSLVGGAHSRAGQIVEEAIKQVSVLRGRLGAFERNTLDTNVNQLQITLENLTSAESAIRDVDFALETSNLTRSQILVNAGTSVLAVANQVPQSVLALLQ